MTDHNSLLFSQLRKRETERRREGANTSNTQKLFLASRKFFCFFFTRHIIPSLQVMCVLETDAHFSLRKTRARTCVDNRTLSFSRFFVFNTNKKLLGTCLCVHLCVYYALQWFSMYVIQRARRALSLSLSLSFRVKYIKILLCVYNTRGAL